MFRPCSAILRQLSDLSKVDDEKWKYLNIITRETIHLNYIENILWQI
jgi:hypothetical protein